MTRIVLCVALGSFLMAGTIAGAQDKGGGAAAATVAGGVTTAAPQPAGLPPELALAVKKGMERGVAFLLSKQTPSGSWLEHPAVTALACAAIVQSPLKDDPKYRAAANRGLDYVTKFAKTDGAIWNSDSEQYPNYTTAISTIALVLANRPQDEKIIRAARAFILGSQFKDIPSSDPSYGGIGYGKDKRPDLSNTQWALEALYLTDHLDREPFAKEPGQAKTADLAWDRATQFLTRCQNLKETNSAVWVTSDPDNRGGFVYMPGQSKAGTVSDDAEGLRSYGSMTYAGLKSMVYAKVDKNDLRVKAAVDWIRRHYTFSENPGVADAGLYYYLHTAAKALAALGDADFVDAAGKAHNWRAELIQSILSRQRETGEWRNDNARWMESVPELTTAYMVLALEVASGSERAFGPHKP